MTNSFCRTDPEIAKAFARVTFTSDNRADLPKVSARTLILQCSEDIIAGQEVGAYVHSRIPGSELVVLKATGHCPNLSAPDEVTAAIRSLSDVKGDIDPMPVEDLEDLYENAPCGYISLQSNGRIFKANRTFATWLGYDAADLMGKRLSDLLNIAGRIFFETHVALTPAHAGIFQRVCDRHGDQGGGSPACHRQCCRAPG